MTRRSIGRRTALTAAIATGAAAALRAPAVRAQAAWEGPRIVASGFTQERTSVRAAVLVENPNVDIGLAQIEFEVGVYDAGGTLLETRSDTLHWLAPGQRTAIAVMPFLSDGQTAASIDIQLKSFGFRPPEPLRVTNPAYVPDRFSPAATGTIVNPYPRALADVELVAVLYDSGSAVIGGATTFVQSIPANGTAAARVTSVPSVASARAELFVNFGGSTKFL